MSQELINALFLVLASVLGGAVVGGGTVLVVYGMAVHSVLNSPVIIESLHGAFASLPAPLQADVIDTVKLADAVVAAPPSTDNAPAVSVALYVPPANG